jgi:DNA modification methylase
MFSVKGDTVLDPFLGIGTTTYAAMASCRNSVGYELESAFREPIFSGADGIVSYSNERISKRITDHLNFIKERLGNNGVFKYINENYDFPVVTKQEKELIFNELISIGRNDDVFEITYSDGPQKNFAWMKKTVPNLGIDTKSFLKRYIINSRSGRSAKILFRPKRGSASEPCPCR